MFSIIYISSFFNTLTLVSTEYFFYCHRTNIYILSISWKQHRYTKIKDNFTI